jgi:hypothetical protein
MAKQHIRATVARLIAWLLLRGPVVLTAGPARLIFDPKTGRLLPVMAGADDGDGGGSGDDQGNGGGDGDGDGGSGDGDGDGDPDWKAQARKHERRAKQAQKRADDLQRQIDELKVGNQSEQERAIEDAKKQARQEALAEANTERRRDRLEVAVTRLAAKGIKVGSGDDAQTVRFADPEDALVFLERELERGDLDTDDIYDSDGQVQTSAVTTALADLLERKPRLAADDNGSGGGSAGSSDAGRGSGGATLTADDVRKLAAEDPQKFNKLLDEGAIPQEALLGR